MKKLLQLIVLAGMSGGLLAGCTGFHPNNSYSTSDLRPGATITVAGNQNAYTVAKQNNVAMRDIIALNNLKPPYNLSPGQQIILPVKQGETSSGIAPPPDAAPRDEVERVPLSSSSNGGVSSVPLSNTANDLKPIGTVLPPITTPAPSTAPQALSAASNMPTAIQGLNAPLPPPKPIVTTVTPNVPGTTPQAALQTAGSNVVAANPKLASAAQAIPTAPAAAPTLVWPLQGEVVSGYGPKGQGLNNDGVNIAAPKGTPVTAAGSGIVVYAGNEMKGFGNLILIRHADDYVTAYAHLDRMLVQKDAVVAQGDEIGLVGKSGDVPSPQLHFEVRHLGKAIDPNIVVKAQ